MICKHVYYSGLVQGVGFRYTAQSVAEGFAVSGYVRNLASGDVELVAQGTTEQVEAFLRALAARMAHYIRRTTVQDETPAGHQGFHVRY